jgi:hypothetical protein
MPSGTLSPAQLIVEAVLAARPRRIVDLGMGTGKYGFLIREQTDFAENRLSRDSWELRIDGVEGYPAYIGDHQRAFYDEIIVGDIRDFVRDGEAQAYDVALAIDVIEHLEPADAIEFTRNALRVAGLMVIATPKMFYEQAGEANSLEQHRSWWPTKALARLAATCDAQSSLARVRGVNVAVLSTHADPPELANLGWSGFVEHLKDSLVPEHLRYRRIRATGPSVLDAGPSAHTPA